MLDIKAVKLKGFTKIRYVELLSETEAEAFSSDGSAPYVIRIEGENFNKTTDVVINGHEANYKVLGPTIILAILPSAVRHRSITSIYVLTDKENFSISSLYSYELGASPGTISGPGKAVAQFLKVLLTTPGSDIFDRNLGAGLLQFPGAKTQGTHVILAKAAAAVQRAADQIRARNVNLDLPPDENIQSVEIVSIDFVKGNPTSVEIRVRVNTLAERGLAVALQLGAQGLVQDLLRGEDVTGTA